MRAIISITRYNNDSIADVYLTESVASCLCFAMVISQSIILQDCGRDDAEQMSQNKVPVCPVTLPYLTLPQVLYLQQAEVTRERVYAMHQSSIDGVEDMSALAELHEAAIMHNLYQRYQKDSIYVSGKKMIP